jgi:hypothetical protein
MFQSQSSSEKRWNREDEIQDLGLTASIIREWKFVELKLA